VRSGKAGRPRGKASVTGAAKARRAKSALELRIEGLSVEQIAQRLGVAHSTVSLDLSHALGDLAEANKGKSAEFVELEVARCDELIRALWARRKDPSFAEKILKAIDRKAKLLGIDAPKRSELTGKDGGPLIGLGDLLAMGFDSNGPGGSGTNTPPAVGS